MIAIMIVTVTMIVIIIVIVVAQWGCGGSLGLWWPSGRAPGYKSCGPRFKSWAIPTVPKNFPGALKWQVKIVQRHHMS